MSVVVLEETGAVSIFKPGSADLRASQRLAGVLGTPRVPGVPGVTRPREPWKSTLAPHDLECLLRVVEDELIPRMLADYSPARHAPRLPDPSSE